MLEKPNLPDSVIISRLSEEYGIRAARLDFLPLGADVNTAVYRAVSRDGAVYFLKLRKGQGERETSGTSFSPPFDEIAVAVPQFLHAKGIRTVMAPLETRAGKLWGRLGPYAMILYPYIEGKDGYQVRLSDPQWVTFGAAMGAIHETRLPEELARRIPREDFSAQWREMVREHLAKVETAAYADPVAVKFAAYMHAKRCEINHMVERAGLLARSLRGRDLEFVLCHSDIHAGNLLLAADEALYIVDWDNPIYAPKERDLMMIGGSGAWHDAREEELFYFGYQGRENRGYGPVEVDRVALAYYRYERIIWDIAAYCEQLLMSSEGAEDREQSYQYFTRNFLPDQEFELALKTDRI